MYFTATKKNETTEYAIEVYLDPKSVPRENETSYVEDETTNSDSNSVPIGPKILRVSIGGTEVMNSEEEKDNGDDDGDPQPFSQVQTRISRSGRIACPLKLHKN